MEHITNMEQLLAAAKKYIDGVKLPDEKSSDSESFIRGLMLASKHDSNFDLFRDIQGFLDADGRAIALAVIWPTSMIEPYAGDYCTKEEAIEWFTSCNSEKLMGSRNIKLLSKLPDVITVFRGVNGLDNLEPTDAISWTINPIITMAYPDDKFGVDCGGHGYKASIKKEDVFAYFWEADMEIDLNPDKLFDIKYINGAVEMIDSYASDKALELVNEQRDWQREYFNNKVYQDLWEKLEPLGRASEFVEATMNFEKRKALVEELLGFSL